MISACWDHTSKKRKSSPWYKIHPCLPALGGIRAHLLFDITLFALTKMSIDNLEDMIPESRNRKCNMRYSYYL